MIEDKEIPPTLSDEELIAAVIGSALNVYSNRSNPMIRSKFQGDLAIETSAILSRFSRLREQITVEQATVRAQREGMAGIRASRDFIAELLKTALGKIPYGNEALVIKIGAALAGLRKGQA